MLSQWREEYGNGYSIQYRKKKSGDFYQVFLNGEALPTIYTSFDNALDYLKTNGGYYYHPISMKIHYGFHSSGNRWILQDIIAGEYSGQMCAVMVEYADGYCIAELPSDDAGESKLIIIHKQHLKQ